MLSDVIGIFEKKYKQQGDKLIIDAYIPDDGEYIIIDPKQDGFQILDKVYIKKDKKIKEVDRSSSYFDFICNADYMSRYLESNKAIGDKNIHSNNYLTFFVKKENVHNGKITNEIIEEYYIKLKNPLIKYKTPKAKKLYISLEKKFGEPDGAQIEKIEAWIKDNIFNLVEPESKDKSYLKIFFKFDLETYKNESERYILANIYNSSEYNEMINSKIYGLPNDNMGLNSKKPYLENKSRKTTIPYLISEEEVLIQKKFFDYLANQVAVNRPNIYIQENNIASYENDKTPDKDFCGYYLRLKKGKEVEIHDFDTIGCYKTIISPLSLENVLQLEKSKIQYNTIHKLSTLKNVINEVFFSNYLTTNFFTDAKDIKIKDNALKRNLLLSRTTLFSWFYKGNDNNAWKIIKQSSLDLIKGSINKGYLLKAGDQFNLRCGLKKYFEGGDNMADILADIKNRLRTKIASKEGTESITSDREYYFAVGQLSNYFISLSKTKSKTHSLANPIINAKSDDKIKEELKKLYKKYNYTIKTASNRFNNLFAMVSSYIPEGKTMEDLIIAGYLHSNLIYEKSNKEESEDE
ncbi:CRISPR-associated protein Csh1 [Natronincola peptidivorans]|uniref:CRISPR-associated protein Csh1 n=1 Tax=Natronincola peptidivorans TaxID=426128 RepID=A0A1I0DER2_9FIRM|nr:type I-B CRISPR-associated protein Cas8b/Csh1 [Natronincola peptidivorans]SET30228.1 CRISPR-associated protein Csh1 [Natronincola peptidivorans]